MKTKFKRSIQKYNSDYGTLIVDMSIPKKSIERRYKKTMETQNELEREIGNIELERNLLKPAKVKILKVEIIEVGEHKNKKVNCTVKHPDREEPIVISSVSFLKEKAVVTSGLWFNTDKEDNIQKSSALAVFLEKTDSKNLKELEGKEVETELEGNYLVFKGY